MSATPLMNPLPFHLTCIWQCPACGRLEQAGPYWTPNTICQCSGYTVMVPNENARRLMDRLHAYHERERMKARCREYMKQVNW